MWTRADFVDVAWILAGALLLRFVLGDPTTWGIGP